MATMIEKQLAKAEKDVQKYTNAIERHTKALEKKTAKCIKLGCNWTEEEFRTHRKDGTITDEQYQAWFDMDLKKFDIEEAQRGLTQAEKHLARITGKADEKQAKEAEATEISEIEDMWINKAEDTDYEKWLKTFKARCLKDGIIIDEASLNWVTGKTASGKGFALYINDGYTVRSLHCYALYINNENIFTSGDFSTAYRYLKQK